MAGEAIEVNPAWLSAFARAARNVLATMAHLETSADISRDADAHSYDCSGIISFSGSVVGTMAIRSTSDVAVAIVAAMVGEQISPGTPDFNDAFGELANMIAGAAKVELGGRANISIPSVITGAGHRVCHATGIPRASVSCQTMAGQFTIEISLQQA